MAAARSPAPTPGCSTSAKSPLVSAWLRPAKAACSVPDGVGLGGGEAVGKPCSHAAGTRSVAVNARGPCSVCNRPWPTSQVWSGGRSESAGKPPAPPRPAPQGCTATTRWGAAGVSCCTSASNKPRMAGDTPLAGHAAPVTTPAPAAARVGMAAGGTATPRPGGVAPVGGAAAGVWPCACSAWLARVKVEHRPRGHQRRAPLRRTPPCPRPAACFAAAKRLRPAPAPRRAQGCGGDPSGWTWWSGEQWRGPPATGAFAMCNRAWRWELNAFWP